MRPLEALLLLANLATFFSLAFPLLRAGRITRFLPFTALLATSAQMLLEGARWQMAPAYAVAVSLLLVSLLPNMKGAADDGAHRPLRRLGRRVGVTIGVVALVFTCLLPLVFPVFRFAAPSGPYGIGTLTYHWVDTSRSEVFGADPKVRRQLLAQIWYPTKANPLTARDAYLKDADAVTKAFARIHGKPAFLFGHLKYVTTNAMPSVPAAVDQAPYPVLLFLEGATGYRQMNTFQVEQLVSYGYIVVAIDQPGAAAIVAFPDGHQIAGLTPAQFRTAVGPSYLPGRTGLSQNGVRLANGRTLHDSSIIPYLAQDAAFTLDQLAVLNQADPNGILNGKLDLQRIGAFGVSLGGIVVGEACRIDSRLHACLIMDAPMPTDVVKAGLQQPSMWITRDAASMRLERQTSGGWPVAEIEAHQTSMRAVYDSLSGPGYFVRVPGTFHSNFTDIANWTPLAAKLGLTGPIDEHHAHEIINAYSLAFFDRHLLRRPADLLDGPAERYPNVLFESRRP